MCTHATRTYTVSHIFKKTSKPCVHRSRISISTLSLYLLKYGHATIQKTAGFLKENCMTYKLIVVTIQQITIPLRFLPLASNYMLIEEEGHQNDQPEL